MRDWTKTCLTCLALLAVTASAKALMIAPPSIPARVAVADAVVVGKVTGFADKLEPGEMHKGDTRQMQVATVEVSEAVFGPKARKIKVGFFPPAAPEGAGRPPIRRGPTVQLIVGQEALCYLVRHPTKKDVYVAQMYYDVASKKDNPNFAKELDEAKKAARVLANAKAGLESKDADERYHTAAMLLLRYRTPRPGSTRTTPIPAAESKAILTELAKADWNKRDRRDWQLSPQGLFGRLGLTAKDGWTQPTDFKKFGEAAKKWLADNADKYRLERFVWPGSDEKSAEPEK